MPNKRKELEKLRSLEPTPSTFSECITLTHWFFQNVLCAHTFEIKPVTYRHEKDRILYSMGCLEGTPADDWSRAKATLELNQPELLTWKYYVNFLQEDLKPKNLRMFDIGSQLKKLRQRPGQTVSELANRSFRKVHTVHLIIMVRTRTSSTTV